MIPKSLEFHEVPLNRGNENLVACFALLCSSPYTSIIERLSSIQNRIGLGSSLSSD